MTLKELTTITNTAAGLLMADLAGITTQVSDRIPADDWKTVTINAQAPTDVMADQLSGAMTFLANEIKEHVHEGSVVVFQRLSYSSNFDLQYFFNSDALSLRADVGMMPGAKEVIRFEIFYSVQ
jgi:hypothetical protein